MHLPTNVYALLLAAAYLLVAPRGPKTAGFPCTRLRTAGVPYAKFNTLLEFLTQVYALMELSIYTG